MVALSDIEGEIVDELCADEGDAERLTGAFELSHRRLGEAGTHIPYLVEAHQLFLYWLAVAEERYQTEKNARNRFILKYVEGAAKGLSTSIIASMSLRKQEDRFNGGGA